MDVTHMTWHLSAPIYRSFDLRVWLQKLFTVNSLDQVVSSIYVSRFNPRTRLKSFSCVPQAPPILSCCRLWLWSCYLCCLFNDTVSSSDNRVIGKLEGIGLIEVQSRYFPGGTKVQTDHHLNTSLRALPPCQPARCEIPIMYYRKKKLRLYLVTLGLRSLKWNIWI
jgi:hypothetical protein